MRLAFGAGINFVALENLKHYMLDVLPQGTGQLGYLQAATVGGESAWRCLPDACTSSPRQCATAFVLACNAPAAQGSVLMPQARC